MSTDVQPAAFKEMQTDIQVSMDDVVSAFVSQYENNLFDRKKELTGNIKRLEDDLKTIDNDVLAKVTGASYDVALPLGLKVKVGDGSLNWNEGKVAFSITVENGESTSRYNNTITVIRSKPIPAAKIKARTKISTELDELRTDLNEVLVNLKSVTRKERQVRGRIAMRKLEDSGYASLMQDEELAQLVQLDD